VGRLVEIKGIRDCLLIRVNDNPEIATFDSLSKELAKKRDFLKDSRIVVDFGRRSLGDEQIAELQQLFEANELTLWAILSKDEPTREATRRAGLATRLSGSATDLDGNTLSTSGHSTSGQSTSGQSTNGTLPSRSLPQANALFLRETMRSGRSIYHEGHVVILGDVNPGAEVIATGHVIVWGRLRGLVHAGAAGDRSSSICALDLNPTQLRIADQIAVPPTESRSNPIPEQAIIIDGQIVAEPWYVKHAVM
jgi:septum site-determining protein MinC